MRRLIISCAVIAVALLAQLTFVNRLALPGAAGPDLVLLAVVAIVAVLMVVLPRIHRSRAC